MPPKRPVQAPQRRDPKKRAKAAAPRAAGRNLMPIILVAAAIVAAGIAAGLYFGLRGGGTSTSSNATPTAAPGDGGNPLNSLPGVRKIAAPWLPEYAHLNDRLQPLKLNALSQEALAYHIHEHLDVFLNGKPIAVPALVGINDSAYLTELHTHDASGIIHVESESADKHYTVGSFFAEWGIYLSKDCVGAYCQGYTWYLNGKKQASPIWDLELKPHQVIVIAIGKPPKKIRSTYAWNGL